jgi:hypothetical protein
VYVVSYFDAASAVNNKEDNLVLLGDERRDEARFNLPQTIKHIQNKSQNKTLK